MKKSYIITFITEFAVMAVGLLLYRFAATMFGQEGFSFYALVRRDLSFLQPLLLLGLGVGIPRYIGYCSKENKYDEEGYFLGGLFISTGFTIVSGLLILIYSKYFAFWLFGNSNYSNMIYPLCAMLLGSTGQALCYSYFRGKTMMIPANLLQIIVSVVIPLVAFLFFGTSVYWTLMVMGILWFIIPLLFCMYLILHLNKYLKLSKILLQTREVLNYSIRRVPGDFALTTLLTLPVTFVTHYSSITEAGFVALGIAVFGMVGAVTSPVGIILLPQASKMISRGNITELRQFTFKILKYSILMALFLSIFFQLGSTKIIMLYLGTGYEAASKYIAILLIGSVPYSIYLASRSVLDAFTVKAINAKNLLTSLFLFVIICSFSILLKMGVNGILMSFVFSIYILGVLTLYQLQRVFKYGFNIKDLGRAK